MEATGGFEPPNRGFADLRLRPLGYVALFTYAWCRGGDSNSYSLAATAPSTLRVYQFHHLGLYHCNLGHAPVRLRRMDIGHRPYYSQSASLCPQISADTTAI